MDDLHHTVFGDDGPWVTLLHGGLMHSAGWTDQARRLAASARVLTLDFRGYGASGRPAGGYTVDQFARDVLDLWDALEIDHSILVGFSMGGFVALETALRAGERVAGLVLVGTAARLTATLRAAFLARAERLETSGSAAEPLLAGVPADARCVAATFRGIATFDRLADVGAIRCPVLVVSGQDDAAIPPVHSRTLHDAIPGSRLVIVPGCGHTVHSERPDLFTELVEAHIAEVVTLT